MLAEAARAGEHISLTGGSTPKRAYEEAARLEQDWSRATLWWGDDRCVAPDDELSNYRPPPRTLLDLLPHEGHPQGHRIPAERGPHVGGDDYERDIRAALGEQIPRLDLMVLGLGP